MATPAEQEREPLAPGAFREVIGRFASGVTVITTARDGVAYGTTASAVSSLSLEPPMLVICMNRDSSTGQAIDKTRRFAVNILGEGQVDLATRFAKKDPDKFAGVATTEGPRGQPLLADALATMECRVVDAPTGGTHWVFLSEVESASARPGAPLAYFRGQFGRLRLEQELAAYDLLRRHVVAREIPVGTTLELDRLADMLDVPATSTYHAVVELVGEGLVSTDSEGHFVVRPLTRERALDAYGGRFAVLKGVLELTVGKSSPAELAELDRLVEATAPSDATIDEWISALLAVFDYLVGLPGSIALLDAFRRVSAPANILSAYMAKHWPDTVEHRIHAYKTYRSLANAIASGDTGAAASALDAVMTIAIESAEKVFAEREEI